MNSFSKLQIAAERSLKENIQLIDGKKYLSAGGHQFRTLWTRDFCLSVKGLLLIGEQQTALDHLQLLLKSCREDGLVPRVVDSMPPRYRVMYSGLARVIKFLPAALKIKAPLNPEFVDEHGTEAIDSNLLFVLALKEAGVSFDAESLLKYYRDKIDTEDGLIVQGAFSDWQDSVQRKGKTLYTNLLYWRALQLTGNSADLIARSLRSKFYSDEMKLFISMQDHSYLSLESHLMMLDWKFLNERESAELYKNLKISQFFQNPQGIPGFNTFPHYPSRWRSLAVKVAGLGHYHDSIYWTWLMAYSAKVAIQMKDLETAKMILRHLEESLSEDGFIYEILDPEKALQPWKSWLYHSESPFSWGAAYVLYALKELS